MSVEFIVAVSVLGFGGLVVLFYISHSIEKQRREKALQIANLNDYIYRLQRLVDTVPLGYMGKDLKITLLEQIKLRLEKLVNLAPSKDRFRKSLDATAAQISELSSVPDKQPVPAIKNKEEMNQIRALLQDLSKVIENMSMTKTIPPEQAQKHLLRLQKSFTEANIGLMIRNGEASASQGKAKLAIMHYKNALSEMRKRNQQNAYDAKIQQIAAIVSELEQSEQSQSSASATAEDTNSELNQAVDELLKEDESWKKKYF